MILLQFERVCVRDTLARGTPLSFRSWPRPRDAASATATLGFHFILQNRRADKPAAISFHFCVAARTSRGSAFRPPRSRAIERFSTREQQGGIASGHLSDCFFPGRTTTDFDGVVRPRAALISSVSSRAGRRPRGTRDAR